MIGAFFHRWERRLADTSRGERVVRPFEWGLEWLDGDGSPNGTAPYDVLHTAVEGIMRDTAAFFTPEPTSEYEFEPASGATSTSGRQGYVGAALSRPMVRLPFDFRSGPRALVEGKADPTSDAEAPFTPGTLRFPSALVTPHPANNVVQAQWFPAVERPGAPRRAVVVLPQWNSDAQGHVGLCRLLARAGVGALRISLPYHDRRMPPELTRADYIVSANVARTLQVCRQAVLDARRALWWLRDQGFDRLGLVGTSLGSCLAMLTACHEPLVRAQALNHVSPFFADVVWRGLSTEHVRTGLDGHIALEQLRDLWRPISPWSYLERARGKKTLLVYARYDLTFPVDLSKKLINEFARRDIDVEVAALPCGHYTTGEAPFKFLDAYYLIRFLRKALA